MPFLYVHHVCRRVFVKKGREMEGGGGERRGHWLRSTSDLGRTSWCCGCSIYPSTFYPSILILSIYPLLAIYLSAPCIYLSTVCVSIYAWFQFWFCHGSRRSLSCGRSVAVASVTFTCSLLLLLFTIHYKWASYSKPHLI